MYFDERRTHFLEDRLSRRLKECRIDSFYNYYRLLLSDQGKRELVPPGGRPDCQRNQFLPQSAQLELFHKHVLEELLRTKPEKRDFSLKIWSAGCSTGQEPYTIGMLVADALAYYELRNAHRIVLMPKPLIPSPWKVEILASDISYSVLRTAQDAVYNDLHMASVDYNYRLRYFDKVGDRYAVKKALKELVHFDFHNLKTEFLPQQNDIIFCRNVMMYFDEAEQKRLVEKFWRCLNPGGHLFVGHAESLLGLTDKFQMVYRNNGTAYVRVGEIEVSHSSDERGAELRDLFFESAQELLQSLNDSALRLEKSPQDLEIVREIRRTVHTLKGDAAACSFRELSEAAHELEDALALEQVPTGASLADVAFAAADMFNHMLNAYRKHKKPAAAESLHKMIRKLAEAPKGKAGGKKKTAVKTAKAESSETVWTEYEELAIQKALAGEKHVYHLVATIDANCAMPIAARQMVLNAHKERGGSPRDSTGCCFPTGDKAN